MSRLACEDVVWLIADTSTTPSPRHTVVADLVVSRGSEPRPLLAAAVRMERKVVRMKRSSWHSQVCTGSCIDDTKTARLVIIAWSLRYRLTLPEALPGKGFEPECSADDHPLFSAYMSIVSVSFCFLSCSFSAIAALRSACSTTFFSSFLALAASRALFLRVNTTKDRQTHAAANPLESPINVPSSTSSPPTSLSR